MCIHEGREGLYLDSPKNTLTSSKARGCFSGITYSYLPIFGDTPCGGDIVYFPTLALVSQCTHHAVFIALCLLFNLFLSSKSYYSQLQIYIVHHISIIEQINRNVSFEISTEIRNCRPKWYGSEFQNYRFELIFFGSPSFGSSKTPLREDSGLSHPAQQQILHMQKDGLLEVFVTCFLGGNFCKTLLS